MWAGPMTYFNQWNATDMNEHEAAFSSGFLAAFPVFTIHLFKVI